MVTSFNWLEPPRHVTQRAHLRLASHTERPFNLPDGDKFCLIEQPVWSPAVRSEVTPRLFIFLLFSAFSVSNCFQTPARLSSVRTVTWVARHDATSSIHVPASTPAPPDSSEDQKYQESPEIVHRAAYANPPQRLDTSAAYVVLSVPIVNEPPQNLLLQSKRLLRSIKNIGALPVFSRSSLK